MLPPSHLSAPLSWNPPDFPKGAGTRALGRWGEELAARHLAARGYDILTRNWRCSTGELDLVVRSPSGGSIAAVEVKTRRVGGQVPSIEAISRAKLVRLRTVFATYLSQEAVHARSLGIDLVAIDVYDDEFWRLHHIEAIQ